MNQSPDAALGIYVHLPFCPYICPYCDFAKWPHRASAARDYLQALHREIDAHPQTSAATVYFGGGTPNTYGAGDIAELLAHIDRVFPGGPGREATIEVNPELVSDQDVREYAAAGVTRMSVGVQSFVPQEIRVLGRRHDAADIRAAIAAARAAGLRDVNLDLIFGVPGQTLASWRRSLDEALALEPDHMSLYGLTIENGTPYAEWFRVEPRAFADQDAEAELFAAGIEALESAGFEQYEISNFARPGHRCAHNANYWADGEYVGLGVGAASYRNGIRSVHTRDIREYVSSARAGDAIPSESERLEGAAKAGEAIMLALRTAQGLSLAAFKERYGLDFLEQYAPIVESHRAAGLLEVNAQRAWLTRRGRFLANDICASFITLP